MEVRFSGRSASVFGGPCDLGRREGEAASGLSGQSPDIFVTDTGGPSTWLLQAIKAEAGMAGVRSLWTAPIESIQAPLPAMRALGRCRVPATISVAAKELQPRLKMSDASRAGVLASLYTFSREVADDRNTVDAVPLDYINADRATKFDVENAIIGPKARVVDGGLLNPI